MQSPNSPQPHRHDHPNRFETRIKFRFSNEKAAENVRDGLLADHWDCEKTYQDGQEWVVVAIKDKRQWG